MNRKMRSKFNNQLARKRKDNSSRWRDSASKTVEVEVGQRVVVEGQEYTVERSDGRPAREKLN